EFVITNRFVTVLGQATDDVSLVSVVITNNRGGSTAATVAGANWTANQVALRVGTNELVAVATDAGANRASDMVTVIRVHTNYVDTTLRTAKARLTLAATTNGNTLTVSGAYNDSNFIFDPSNDVVEVMFGDYDGSVPSNSLVNLRFKSTSPSNTLTALS